MQPMPDQLLDNIRRLHDVLHGEDRYGNLPPEEALEAAERSVAGQLRFAHGAIEPRIFDIGRSNVDWTGAHTTHGEWRAQLQRFRMLPALAQGYAQSGDSRFAEAAADYVRDWLRQHPRHDDGAWTMSAADNTLNIAGRIQAWFNYPEILASESFPPELLGDMVASAAAQLDYLSAHIADRINWRVHHAFSLLCSGLRLRQHPGSGRWLQHAADVLNDAFHRQVNPDGTHYEHTPGYHTGMARQFVSVWRIGQAHEDLGLAIDTRKLAAMWDYTAASTRPDGHLNGIHDSPNPPYVPDAPPHEAHLAARAQFRAEAGLPDEMPPVNCWFPDAQQVTLRDQWGPNGTYLTFDASKWGGGHNHLSRNAIQLCVKGRPLIVDPGVLTYEPNELGNYGRATRSHATVTFNQFNQSTADPRMTYRAVPGYDYIASLYAGGYWPRDRGWTFDKGLGPGVYGEHHRQMLWVRERFIAVIDHMFHAEQDNPPTITANWQFASVPLTFQPEQDRAYTTTPDGNVLALIAQYPAGTRLAQYAGEEAPVRGWTPGRDGREPAPQLAIEAPHRQPADTHFVTIFVPFEGADPPPVRVTQSICPDDTSFGHIILKWDETPDRPGGEDHLCWTGRTEIALDRKIEGVHTDAGLFHLQKDAQGELQQGLALDATFLAPWSPHRRDAPGLWTFGPGADSQP